MEAALVDARLRGREAALEATRQTLEARAAWIDNIAATLQRLGSDPNGDEHLRGLGAGAAREEADLGAYVRRSSTLMLARAAMVATREELLARRKAQQQSRTQEIEALEAALVRVEVRLAARERLLLGAVRHQEALATREGAAAEGGPSSRLAAPAAHHRHAATESLSAEEASAIDGRISASKRRASGERMAPPVLDLTAPGPGSAPLLSSRGGRLGAALTTQATPAATLRLAGVELRRDQIEIDARSKTLLASVQIAPAQGATVELHGESGGGPLFLPALVRRVVPGADGGPIVVVLAPAGWGSAEWHALEGLLSEL